MPRLNDDTREVYRLSRPTRDASGRTVLEPIPGAQFFPDWRSANKAARTVSTAAAPIVTESVLVDARGRVVFPPATTARRSRQRWHVAPILRFKPVGQEQASTRSRRRPRRHPGNGKP